MNALKKKFIGGVLFACTVFFLADFVFAGSNPLSKYEADSTAKVGYFDLVVSLDWTPDQDDKDGRLKTAFEQFGKDVYKMSEGKQKIRKLYVFTDSKQMDTADIRFKNVGGRSNANANGIFDSGGRILTYTAFSSGNKRSDSYIGHTIAHEFGHYAYGLYDEYVGSASSSTWPSKPLSGDTSKSTIMNHQGDYQWFSIASDYSDTSKRKTAQWRVFSSSAWETLVRDPKNDKLPNNFTLSYARVRYDEFDGMAVPTTLTKPSTGWDEKFEIIYMTGTIAILVVDKSGSMGYDPPALPYAISAAKQFVDLMQTGESVAVVSFSSGASTLVDITELKDQAAKDQVKASIDTLSAGGGTSFSAGLNQAMTLLSSGTTSVNTRYVILMSDGQASKPDLSSYTSQSIPVYTVGLGSDIDEDVLRAIASETNATYYAAATGGDLSTVYAQINRAVVGNQQAVSSGESELTQGDTHELETVISDLAGTTTFRASWDDGNTIGFYLESPSGTMITPSSLPSNVTYNGESTYGIYTITSPESGTWTSVLSGDTIGTTAQVSQEVGTSSLIAVNVSLSGGQYPKPIGIMASVNGPEAVVGATVVASVTGPSTAAAIPDITLKDDGKAPDLVENDGVYSGFLTDYDMDGNYTVDVMVSNPNGNAQLDTSGSLESGDDSTAESLPKFQRIGSAMIAASGVSAYDAPSSISNAMQLSADNTIQYGSIASQGDEAWYAFSADTGTTYHIQTSNLASYDTTSMATLVTLYDVDGTTTLDSSSGYDNSNISYIEWTAPSDGTYYIKVEHTGSGTGGFGITVGTIDLYRADQTYTGTSDDSDDDDDDDSSDSLCFIGSLNIFGD